ncbi:MAG TPA: hypothetical protein VLF60_00775 [Candidatus Saccharimonadales bacterium]|nr:hypothetical protein [Candidatus Saccharimonadales bacterium]
MKRLFRPFKKRLLFVIVAAIVILGAGGGYLAYRHWWHHKPVPAPQLHPADQINKQIEGTYKAPQNQPSNSSTDTNSKPNSSSNNSSVPTSIIINRAGQADTGQPVSIRATIYGLNAGTCQATFKMDGQTDVTTTSAVTQDATTVTCGTFDVPLSKLPVSGNWTLHLIAQNGSTTTPEASQIVKVTK